MKVISVIREKLLLLKLDLTRTWKEKKRSHPLGVNTKFLFSKSWERQTSVSCKTVVTWVSSSGISSPSEILYLRNLPDTFPYFWCPLIYPSTPAPPHPTPRLNNLQVLSRRTSFSFSQPPACSREILTAAKWLRVSEGCGKYNRFVQKVIALEWAIITIIMTILFGSFSTFLQIVFSLTSFFFFPSSPSSLLDTRFSPLKCGSKNFHPVWSVFLFREKKKTFRTS